MSPDETKDSDIEARLRRAGTAGRIRPDTGARPTKVGNHEHGGPQLEARDDGPQLETSGARDDGQLLEAAGVARRLSERLAREGFADISYAEVDSPFGRLTVARTQRGLLRLAFPEETQVLERLAQRLSPRLVEAPDHLDPIRRELEEFFEGKRREFSLALDWSLIEGFPRRILRATATIPYGGVSSYGEVAGAAGSPRGSRAAGNALGSNPLPIVIPCHRVLRSGGAIGGYAGGPERKRRLLELEGAIEPLRA